MSVTLQFGLNPAVPESVTCAWGARWIFPDDMLPDRQSFPGIDTPAGEKLRNWLNTGALKHARKKARLLAEKYIIEPNSGAQVTLHDDGTGIIVANPNRSYGYLYVAAWLKEEEKELSPRKE